MKHWITINDPWELCNVQFGNAYQPFYEESGIGNYLCGHHALLAHAKAYRVYKNEFQWIQNGKKWNLRELLKYKFFILIIFPVQVYLKM